MDRDLFAVGAGNLIASLLGGLPMISEIVRSKANIDNGGKTRFANFWHAIFLLLCVAFIPTFLHLIPLAALAAMLVYTGFRLTHPTEFIHIYRIGREQLAIFITTMVMVVVTDLLVGVLIGVILKVSLHLANGVPLRSLFKPYLEVEDVSENTSLIRARDSAVFSNWIPFRRQIEQVGLVQQRNLVIDLFQALPDVRKYRFLAAIRLRRLNLADTRLLQSEGCIRVLCQGINASASLRDLDLSSNMLSAKAIKEQRERPDLCASGQEALFLSVPRIHVHHCQENKGRGAFRAQ